MLIDSTIGFDPHGWGTSAVEAENAGYNGVWSPETGHDPFLPLLVAAQHTNKLELGTGIAVAFARNPMNLAMLANDLQFYSKGRFILGIGSQIRAHIQKRFSMPWSHPAPRMREMILAMHAIWNSWNSGTKLEFKGEFFTHTLMTPFFNPGPNPFGRPKILLAAVGEHMTEVAGEVADGMLVHGFTTERYLKEVTLKSLEKGFQKAGSGNSQKTAWADKKKGDFQLSYPGFVVTGSNEAEFNATAQAIKTQIAFYGSTPAYRPVLELHGWGDLQSELNSLSKQSKWVEMGNLIDDDVLNTFAIVCEPHEIADKVLARFGGVIDRFSLYTTYKMEPDILTEIMTKLHNG